MLKNFITTAIRNLKRQYGYTLLNILGLTLGISCSLFILLYLTHELSFDTYHEKADRLFRISSTITEPDDSFKWSVTQNALGPTLEKEYPEVEKFARFNGAGQQVFEYNNRQFNEGQLFLVDSSIFDMFTFDIIAGDPKTALVEPNTIAISKSMADKIFGDEDPIGKILKNENVGEDGVKVTLVYRDMPANSHIIANAMASYVTLPENRRNVVWGGFNLYTYVLLQQPSQKETFASKLPEVIEKYVDPIF
ncbi:MAG: ABC transporter permease, partial [Bacteroidetes bacterium]|nr:ABC transporter permease [Bacteroidota bacterium]